MHGELTIATGSLFGFLLVLARVGGALAFVPLPGYQQTPEAARIVLILGCTLALSPVWPAPPAREPGIGETLALVVGEAAFGITVGITIAMLSEGFLLAGQVCGLQAGYSWASMVDPNSQADSSVLQIFNQLAASLLFFATGMDRHVIRIFARSLETHPPGSFTASLSSAGAILKLGAGMFSTGIRLALPVIGLLLLVDLSLALLGRVNAHLQLLTLAFPAKMLATLAVLGATAALFPLLYERAAARTLGELAAMMGN